MSAPRNKMTQFAGAVWAALRGKRSTALNQHREYNMATVAKLPSRNSEAGTVHWLESHIAEGKSRPHAEVTTLTPGLAGVLLQRNPSNRRLTDARLRHFTSDMRRGAWPLNGETIIVSDDGLLNDGQHRCAAVIEANVSVPATIFFGAPRDSRKTVDLGSARNASHFLSMDGLANATNRAAISRLVLAYEASDGMNLSCANNFSAIECYERARDDAGIGDASAYADAKSKLYRNYVAPSVLGLCLYAFAHVDPLDAGTFIDQIVHGEGLTRKDAAYAVRDRLLTEKSRAGSAEVLMRGWVAFRQGRPLKIVKVLGSFPALV